LELTDVHFGYSDEGKGHKDHVLCGLNLIVPAGSTVGIVGASGSGKSTIGRLLTRSIAADSGMM
jgi:ABC-type multidrug transport system fused ATPase/permease subunit